MENFKTDQPIEHADFYRSKLQTDRWRSNPELLKSLEAITDQQLQLFINDVYFSQVFIESLMMGNLTARGSYLNIINLKFKLRLNLIIKLFQHLFTLLIVQGYI